MPLSIPWVVKLGGSLALSAELPLWLEALAESPVVVVPGGSLFADAVRVAQQHWGFADELAHAMAITAMSQYGRMLQGLCPRLSVAGDPYSLTRLLEGGQSAVWQPDAGAMMDERIKASWDVTSDSLAAWLAEQLGAERLLLIKSTLPPGTCHIQQLVESGLVDREFPELTRGSAREIWLCGPGQHADLRAGLEHPDRFFRRVIPMSASFS
ncbi:MAG: amino acid kinase [Methylococcaceae bacterium]|nr:amino acid kinase [Methylococcaceae bacterium]